MLTKHWRIPNTGATNESRFTALPGGQRCDSAYLGIFSEITEQGYWWSSSQMDTIYPWGINISYNSEGFTNWAASTRKYGFSVRLINDIPVGIKNISNEYFNIYPNPAHDRIVINCVNNKKMNMAIYNLFGELLIQAELNNSKNMIDINTLSSGIYIIKLSSINWSIKRKLIKK